MATNTTSSTSRVDTALIVAAQATLRDASASADDKAKAQAVVDAIRLPPIGSRLLVRTCTIYSAGTLIDANPDYLVLADAVSVQEVGETHEALRTGKWKTAERYPDGELVWVARGAIVDVARFGVAAKS